MDIPTDRSEYCERSEGLDFRCPAGTIRPLWDRGNREKYLLNPDCDAPLSFDPRIWYSLGYHIYKTGYPNRKRPAFYDTGVANWSQIVEILPELFKPTKNILASNVPGSGWNKLFKFPWDCVNFLENESVFAKNWYLVATTEYWFEGACGSVEEYEITTKYNEFKEALSSPFCDLLGYDIEQITSVLSYYNMPGDIKKEIQEFVGPSLNKHNLLSDLDTAVKLCEQWEIKYDEVFQEGGHGEPKIHGIYLVDKSSLKQWRK